MIYAYDKGVQLPITDLYDTQMRLAYISAAKDMYEKAEQEMKDFKKEYGDFYSPIQKDMDWYAQNVTGRIQNKINDLYARGLDPLRNAQARAELRAEMNKINPGDIAQLKQSAANASEFLKNQSKLQTAGLYNPLYAQYEGPSLNEYSTLGDNGLGIWNRMSPTPIQNVAEFGNPYFEGMKPNVHRESKNGIEYSVEAITMDDLRKIADSRFNDLVNTPQGQLMYKYFRDITGDDSKARQMFNETIAAGQDKRIYSKDDYEDNYFKRQALNIQMASHNLAERRFAWEKQKYEDKINNNTINGWTYRVREDLRNKVNGIDLDKIEKTPAAYRSLYNNLLYRMPGDDAKGALVTLSGSDEKQPIYPGSNIKGYSMQFGGSYDNLNLEHAAQTNFIENNLVGQIRKHGKDSFAITKIKRPQEVDALNDFLRIRNIHGYTVNNKASALYDNNGGYDVSFRMLIKESDLDDFFNSNTYDKNRLLNIIGATRRTDFGRSPKDRASTLGWKNETYIELPVVGTITGPTNEIDASVANAVKRGSKYVNEYEQDETD